MKKLLENFLGERIMFPPCRTKGLGIIEGTPAGGLNILFPKLAR